MVGQIRKARVSAFRKAIEPTKATKAKKAAGLRMKRKRLTGAAAIHEQMSKEEDADQAIENKDLMATIVQELSDHPSKLKKVCKYTLSNGSYPSVAKDFGLDTMQSTCITVALVPKTVIQMACVAIGKAGGQERDMVAFDKLQKGNGSSVVLCREVGFETNHENCIFNVNEWIASMVKRSQLIRQFMPIAIGSDQTLATASQNMGWFTLEEGPGEDDPKGESKSVCLNGVYKADLPPLYRFTLDWWIRLPMSLEFAALMPPVGSGLAGRALKNGINLLELYAKDEKVLDLFLKLGACGPGARDGIPVAPAAVTFVKPPNEAALKISPLKLKQLLDAKKKAKSGA